MPTQFFTNGDDSFTVSSPGTYDLDFLAGADRLTVTAAAATVTAQMGEGNDLVDLRAGTTTAYGESGDDRFELRAAGATLFGGGDNDLFSIRAGANNLTA